jgi:hypothetical protein
MATTAAKVTAGAEIDSYCTKCKLDLNHRIIAMDGEKPKRVECLTCRGHHNYRMPKALRAKKKAAPRKRATGATSARARANAEAKLAVERKEAWETAIAGRATTDFTRYTLKIMAEVGLLVHHKKFGDGVIADVLEDGKCQVLFENGAKTLVYGR